MSSKAPNSRRNLDMTIERLYKDREQGLRAKRIMANVIVGQMLPGGVVKGGSAMKVRFGFAVTRFSSDLDTARAKDIDAFIAELDGRLAQGWNGFAGRIVPLPPATPKDVPQQYVMQPYDIKLSYNNKPWITVPMEVGHDEIGDADEPEFYIAPDIVEMFRLLGFPDPKPIALMPLHFQIAQKLHGASEAGSTRVHDLADLQIIVKYGDIDWRRTRETCERLFEYRRQQTWPPTITEHEGWAGAYQNIIEDGELDLLEDVAQAVDWTNGLIDRIASA